MDGSGVALRRTGSLRRLLVHGLAPAASSLPVGEGGGKSKDPSEAGEIQAGPGHSGVQRPKGYRLVRRRATLGLLLPGALPRVAGGGPAAGLVHIVPFHPERLSRARGVHAAAACRGVVRRGQGGDAGRGIPYDSLRGPRAGGFPLDGYLVGLPSCGVHGSGATLTGPSHHARRSRATLRSAILLARKSNFAIGDVQGGDLVGF